MLFFVGVGICNPTTLFYSPDKELTYTESLMSPTCSSHGVCVVFYELAIGNTGEDDLEAVDVSFNGLPKSLKVWKTSVLALTAVDIEQHGAELNEINDAESLAFDIRNLKAGTLIEITLTDPLMPKEEALQLSNSGIQFVQIRSAAHVVNSDPRLTVIGRFLESIF